LGAWEPGRVPAARGRARVGRCLSGLEGRCAPHCTASPVPPARKHRTRRDHGELTELQSYQSDPNDALLELGPIDDDELMHWRAVMQGVPGTAYEGTAALSRPTPPTPSSFGATPSTPANHPSDTLQAAAGPSTSTSPAPTPSRRPQSASSRPSATPTSTSRPARSASICSRRRGPRPTPSPPP
jgi:hypothetical protein